MNIPEHRRLNVALACCCAVLLVACATMFWNYGWLKIRVAWASEQTEIFEEMRTRAIGSDLAGAAGCLQYAYQYYPSGSKQQTGSRLDGIVERERQRVVREIVGYLRIKAPQDLGDKPEAWIERYAPR